MTLQERIEAIENDPTLTPITETQLVEILRGINDPTFSAFKAISKRTDLNKYDAYFVEIEGKKKKNPNAERNPYLENGIINYAEKYKIITGFEYVDSVERRMKAAGIIKPTFEKGEAWHKAVSKALSVHKEKENDFYFRYQYQEDSNTLLEHYHNNDKIGYELFEKFLQDRKNYGNQIEQGVQDPCQFQVISVKNILSISIDKNRYKIIH